MQTDAKPRKVRCPKCGTPVEMSASSPFRPFCSERCRILDLGAWAEGSYAIPTDPPDGELEQTDGEPPGDDDAEH